MKQYILVLLVVIFSGASSRAASLAVSADSAYMAEDYLRAIDLYEQSLAQESRSADTYYNLANAYWRNGNAGRAIINYERALQQNPAHEDARVNLDFVRTRIQDLPEDDSSFLGNLHDGIIAWMSPDAWAWTALILFVAVATMAALYIFAGSVLLRKTGFFGGIALLCLCVYAIIVARQSAAARYNHDCAVVTVPTTLLSSTPKATQNATDKVVAIHEGTKVEIVDSVMAPGSEGSERWYDVKINNATRAWLRARDVERI